MAQSKPSIAGDREKSDKALNTLNEIGLSANEASVYYAALSLGPTTILKISRETDIKRSTVYPIMNSLINKGLINIQTRGVKQVFAAENPEKLERVLDSRRKLLQDTLPELTALYHNLKGSDSFIKHYKGYEGIKSIYDHLLKELKPGDFYLSISDQQYWHDIDPDYNDQFLEKRSKMDLSIRLLLQDSPRTKMIKRNEEKYNAAVKFFPSDEKLNTLMTIVPHKVIIFQTISPYMAMVIENPSVVQMNRILFDIVWNSVT